MLRTFLAQKVTAYKEDPVWISWLALVECETLAFAESTSRDACVLLDQKIRHHHVCFQAVEKYSDSEKPKMFLRYNYPVDQLYVGPLIRTWCMTFEGILQVLKLIAHNSNYKGVCKRMARIWAIRSGLMLHDKKLSQVTSTSLTYSKPSVTVILDGECGELRVMADECGGIGATQELDAFGQQVTRMHAYA